MNPVIRYAFAALLLLGSTLSHAHVWNVAAETSGSDYPSAIDACQARADFRTSNSTQCTGGGGTYCVAVLENMGETAGTCKTYSNTGFNIQGALLSRASGCAEGYVDDGTGTGACTDTPPVTCTAGLIDVDLVYVTDINNLNLDEFPRNYTLGGCDYKFNRVHPAAKCSISESGYHGCYVEVESTGNAGIAQEFGNTNLSESKDTRQDYQEKTIDIAPPSTSPDGTVTESQTEVITTTSGQGGHISETDNTITMTDSDGTVTVYSKNKTTVTHPDGSVTETINKDTGTNTGNKDQYTVDKSTGSIVHNFHEGNTYNYNEYVTNYYNSAGQKTGSESGSSGDGPSGDQGDPEQEGNCGAPGQPSCEVVLAGEDHLGDPSLTLEQSGIMGQFDDHITALDDSGSADISDKILSSPFQLPSTGICNPANFNVVYRGQTLNFFDKFCEAYDSTLHPILQFFFYMFTAIALYFIYLRTLERT